MGPITANSATDDPLAPVDLLVIGFPDGAPHVAGFDALAELIEAGTIRVIDLEFVRRDETGTHTVQPAELPAMEGFDVDFWTGSSADLLDADDLDELASDLAVGELAVVLLIEQQWVLGLIGAWTRGGARLIADGGVPPQDLIDALDAAERR